MRIGFFLGKISDAKSGGGHIFQKSLLQGIKESANNHEFYFYYLSDSELFKDSENLKFINLTHRKKMDTKRQIAKIKKIFTLKKSQNQEGEFNEYILEDNIELMYFMTPSVIKVSVPYVVTVWDLAHLVHPYFPEVSITGWTFKQREEHYRKLLPSASYVVIGNDAGKEQISRYYNIDKNKIKTIPMMTPQYVYELEADDKILAKHNLVPSRYIYYPAQFWPHKNHIRLLKALKELKGSLGPDFKLVFSGFDFGNEQYIVKQAKEMGLEGEVLFLGFIKSEEVISLYRNAFALTYASYFGPDNLPPLEAMALGCPVVHSDIEGAKTQLEDAVLYFNPKSEKELVQQVLRLKDTVLKTELIKKGKKLAEKYSIKNYVKKMNEIIEDFTQIRECWSSTEQYRHL